VVDAQDLDPVRGVVDVIEDPVRASAGTVGTSSSPLSGLPTFLGVRARSPKTNSMIAGTIRGGMRARSLRAVAAKITS
jgi:hypothetical protein